jgi:hypothetical protein
MQVGQPAPLTVRATRSFTFKPTGDALDNVVRDASARVPLIYTCGRCRRYTRANNRRMVRKFGTWVRSVKRQRRPRKPKELERLYRRHKTVLGVTLSRESFSRFRAVRPDLLTTTFAAMVRQGIGPFVVKTHGPTEKAFRGEQVRVRVLRGNRWREVVVKPAEVEDLFQVKKDLRLLAEELGARLLKSVQRDLARIAGKNVKATIVLDEERIREEREKAAYQARKTVVDIVSGQVVLKKGEKLTLTHRAILDEMLSVRCDPCSGGMRACAPEPRRLMKVGGIDTQAITALRNFSILAGPEQTAVLKKQARDGVPRIFIHDPRLAQRRDDKLMVLFDLAARVKDPKKRWKKLQGALDEELKAKVLLQLLKTFKGLNIDTVRAAVSEVYSQAQSEPIIDKSPPLHTEPCTLRTRRRGKPDEETFMDCPIVPLIRHRLLVAKHNSRYAKALKGLAPPAQQAVVELVQALLVANTRYDAAETERRRRAAEARVKPKDRTFRKGDVVVPARKKLTPEDIYILDKMYSRVCQDVPRQVKR